MGECPDPASLCAPARQPDEIVHSFKQRIPGLDELRGIAVLLVLFQHGIVSWSAFTGLHGMGALGVNIFFIISGYLICTILTKTRGRPGFFRTFYIRRIFRIWPLFLAITGLGFLMGLHLKQPVWESLPYYATFTMNFLFAETNEAVAAASGVGIPFTSPMWSLAIEEQFYLFLPLLVGLSKPKRLPLIVVIICSASALGALSFLFQSSDGSAAFVYPNFRNTALRIHYIGFGVLLAVRPRWTYWLILSWLGASCVFFHFAGIMEIAIALALVWVIDHTIHKKPLFQNRFLARAGFLCYGLYLIHWPLTRIIEKGLLPHLGKSSWILWSVFAVFLAVSFVAAHLSFERFENPVQKLRTRFEGSRH